MEMFITLCLTIVAAVIADRICKWLDGKQSATQPSQLRL